MLPQKVLNQSASPITVPLVFVLREIARDQTSAAVVLRRDLDVNRTGIA